MNWLGITERPTLVSQLDRVLKTSEASPRVQALGLAASCHYMGHSMENGPEHPLAELR